jgi:hypothetical protein
MAATKYSIICGSDDAGPTARPVLPTLDGVAVQKDKKDDEDRTHVMWRCGFGAVSVSIFLDHKPLCHSFSLLDPPLEPLHSWVAFLGVIKPYSL